MKSKYQIELDYKASINQAQKLENIAKNIKNMSSNDLEACMNQVKANWESTNATAFITKGRTLQQQIAATAKELDKTAKTIRSIAERTKRAEMEAVRIAILRSSGN